MITIALVGLFLKLDLGPNGGLGTITMGVLRARHIEIGALNERWAQSE